MTAERKALFVRRIAVLAGCADLVILLILGGLTIQVAAQTSRYSDRPVNDEDHAIEEADGRKISRLQGDVQNLQRQVDGHVASEAAINAESRISKLEAIQDVNQKLLIGIALAVGALLAETAYRRLSRGKEEEGS
jgi:hypothetical protein